MTLLLDTHAFLFAISAPERLSPAVRSALEDPSVIRWVSTVSLWEIAVKIQIGKLPLPSEPSFYQEHLRRMHASVLAVEARHTFELMRLPLLHRDPFDRLLIAQARTDGLLFVTRDSALSQYPVSILW
ncbi:MAG: type II toxin-antitoxin system VapC family toxin [Bryobacterales bacterium]|nr:type II toxin-antitoxin system VapC family toxin [Bryobacterales bacterium]